MNISCRRKGRANISIKLETTSFHVIVGLCLPESTEDVIEYVNVLHDVYMGDKCGDTANHTALLANLRRTRVGVNDRKRERKPESGRNKGTESTEKTNIEHFLIEFSSEKWWQEAMKKRCSLATFLVPRLCAETNSTNKLLSISTTFPLSFRPYSAPLFALNG